VQVNPIKSTSKAPGTKRLTLKCNELLSRFALKFNLRPYNQLVGMLHSLFGAIDGICDKHRVEKIETIGDAYLAATGCTASEAGAYTRPICGST
jgi:hypothetical protein